MQAEDIYTSSSCLAIDLEEMNNQYGGHDEIFYSMLCQFEQIGLVPALSGIAKAIEQQDYSNYKKFAHDLKGASSYIAAGPLSKICKEIQDSFDAKQYNKMLQLYPSLVENALAVKRECALLSYANDKKKAGGKCHVFSYYSEYRQNIEATS